ncbi:hypothetical protein [Bacillus paranthracis]
MGKTSKIKRLTVQEQQEIQKVQQSIENDFLQFQNVTVGTRIMKVGRTTNHTHGVITAVNATVDVNYGSGRVARFRDQIITTNLSSGGDSGSLIMTNDGVAIGLLFAGSSSVTIANHIEHIRSLLGIEVAETIL